MKRFRLTALSAVLVAATACGGADEEMADATDMPEGDMDQMEQVEMAVVSIDSPSEGEVTETADVVVTLSSSGVEVAPIASGQLDTAHHHVFLDVDVTPMDQPIPQGDPMIIHMGDGRAGHTFEGLAPGPHRLIAVLADVSHVPLDPPAVDTVTFTVGGGE